MREDWKRNNTPKDQRINEIIEIEWAMFDQVNNQGGRASCQDDEWTFYAMRYSQFSSFSLNVLESYRQDLAEALSDGRNLLTEKYGYMMEYTDTAHFEREIKERLPKVTAYKNDLVSRVANLLLGFEQEFAAKYPNMSANSRPLMGDDAQSVSFNVYALGELKTYSERTLELYYRELSEIKNSGTVNPSFEIHRMTAEFYGYASLDEAEQRLKK